MFILSPSHHAYMQQFSYIVHVYILVDIAYSPINYSGVWKLSKLLYLILNLNIAMRLHCNVYMVPTWRRIRRMDIHICMAQHCYAQKSRRKPASSCAELNFGGWTRYI
jgi:hypothetical protein